MGYLPAADGTLAEPKKSASFMSTRSGMTEGDPGLVHSVVSLAGGHSDVGEKDQSEGENKTPTSLNNRDRFHG